MTWKQYILALANSPLPKSLFDKEITPPLQPRSISDYEDAVLRGFKGTEKYYKSYKGEVEIVEQVSIDKEDKNEKEGKEQQATMQVIQTMLSGELQKLGDQLQEVKDGIGTKAEQTDLNAEKELSNKRLNATNEKLDRKIAQVTEKIDVVKGAIMEDVSSKLDTLNTDLTNTRNETKKELKNKSDNDHKHKVEDIEGLKKELKSLSVSLDEKATFEEVKIAIDNVYTKDETYNKAEINDKIKAVKSKGGTSVVSLGKDLIDDLNTSLSTTWSSTKIQAELDAIDSSVTLADLSANSTTAPNSIYQMSSGIPVEFRRSAGLTLTYWDETNGRFAIGTSSPSAQLDVYHTSAANIYASSNAGSMGLTFNSTLGGTFLWKYWFDRVNTLGLKWDYNGTQMMSLSQTGALTVAGALSFNGNLSMGSNSILGNLSSSIIPYDPVTGNMIFRATTITTGISKIKFQTGTSPTDRVIIDGSGNTGFGTGSGTIDRLVHNESSDAVTNAVTFSQRYTHITSGTATTGFGVGEEYELENASGTNRIASTQEVSRTTATNAIESAQRQLKLMRAGTLTTALTLSSLGALTITDSFTSSGTIQCGSSNAYRIGSRSAILSAADGTMYLTNNALNDFDRLQLGGTTSAFPSIQRSGTGLVARLADDSADTDITAAKVISTAVVRLKGYVVSELPEGVIGDTCYVTDATEPVWGTDVSGGGSVVVPVFYNGEKRIVA